MRALLVSALLAGMMACQSAPQATTAAATKPLPATAALAAVGATAGTVAAPTLAALRHYNLAPLWANQSATAPAHSYPAMEGFYGSVPYRISFYFKQVTRDARQPNVFHVVGLDRYKKVVTPFTGTITVQAIQPFTSRMFVDAPDSTGHAYTAAGQFELREDPTTKGAGTYYGRALLDFYVDAQGRLGQAQALLADGGSENPTKGCGLLFEGYQLSNRTGRRQPVAFANFYGAVVPQALSHLGLGDRSEEVNPNLARLGWNELWENDEWWATSPQPNLSL